MKYLGIDYGKRKIGLSLSDGEIAEPFKVIRFDEVDGLLQKLKFIIEEEKVEKIVIGISEGETAANTKEFAKKLEENLRVSIVFQDETLTTQMAQKMSIEANINRKKRKEMEDAYSASVMLQEFLDDLDDIK